MNSKLKIVSIILFAVFSFYYTEKVALYAQKNTPLRKEISVFKEDNQVSYVNAVIEGDFITPGLNGLTVNVDKSYLNMKKNNVFNKNTIVYEQVKPNVSVDDYPDKIIKKGNKLKNSISFIVNENNTEIINYFNTNKIPFTSSDDDKLCIIKEYYKQDNKCGNKVKIMPAIIFNNLNIFNVLSSISSGSIIYIESNLSIENLKIILDQAKFYSLNVIDIYNLISELNNNY